jgi:hypothetical protein
MPFVTGLDLGQVSDFSALARVELTPCPHPFLKGQQAWTHWVRVLRRWPIGTLYPAIVGDVAADQAGRGDPIAVDQTGVGRAVVDMFRATAVGARIVPVTITAGQHAVQEDGCWRVPKKELVGVLQALMQQRRIKVTCQVPDADVLKKELQNFRVKVTAAANETFGAWREGQHDDLVLALALACWLGERRPVAAVIEAGGRCEADKAPEGVFHAEAQAY